MHRDHLGYGAESSRGVCSKRYVAELHAQGVGPDEAIEAVSRRFGVSPGAARLFVLSHPAWAEAAGPPERMGGRMRSWYGDRSSPMA